MHYSNILLLIAFTLTLSHNYKLQKHVLTLNSDDFPNVLQEFPQIFISFCNYDINICPQTAPIFHQIAKQFNKSNSEVRFAKINLAEYQTIGAIFNIKYYPTYIYFVKGQKIYYRGQNNKENIVEWLNKKINKHVAVIDQNALGSLSSSQKVSIVFHGDLTSNQHRASFEQLALADDFNDYYNLQETELPHGTVQMFRPFGEPVSTQIDQQLKTWILRYEIPVVSRFDNQIHRYIFHDKRTSIIFFQPQNIEQELRSAFKEVAQNMKIDQKKDYLFISIEAQSEHHKRFSNITKVDPVKSPLFILNASKGHKYVLIIKAVDLTSQKISSFISDYQAEKLRKYNLLQQIVYPKKLKNDDQL